MNGSVMVKHCSDDIGTKKHLIVVPTNSMHTHYLKS